MTLYETGDIRTRVHAQIELKQKFVFTLKKTYIPDFCNTRLVEFNKLSETNVSLNKNGDIWDIKLY